LSYWAIGWRRTIWNRMGVKVLILVDWYAPGFKAGGPIRSVVNFADHLENDLDIRVLTTDRDLGANGPYQGIQTDMWVPYKGHSVYYASPASLRWDKLFQLIKETAPDCIYLNSIFSRYFSVYPMLMKRFGMIKCKVVVAPRGMLKDTALQHKYLKKKLFLVIYRMLGLQNGIVFHATDATEMKNVFQHFGSKTVLFKAGNLPGFQPEFTPPARKQKGQCKIVFVGRIHPIKNLVFLLQALRFCKGRIELTVIATLEDLTYWEKCKKAVLDLPDEVTVQVLWDQPNELISELIQQHHIFALPTQGENFGHSIFEAIAAGRPVLISDQTPWKNLASRNAGWDLPLESIDAFVRAIDRVVEMEQDEIMIWCKGAWNYANQYLLAQSDKKVFLNQFS